MKFSCSSKSFKNVLFMVEKAIPKQSTLPVLQNLFLSLKDGKLLVRGNDLEMGIETTLSVDSEDSMGSVLVKSKTLTDVVSKLQSDSINFFVDEKHTLHVNTSDVQFKLLGLPISDYPAFPSLDKGKHIQLPVSVLRELIKLTLFSVSFDDTKKFLNGVLLSYENSSLTCISTDGFRLSLKSVNLGVDLDPFSVIVPYKAINEVLRILSIFEENKIVSIAVSDSQISFSCDSFLLISRLVQGQFPDFNKVIPDSFEHSIKISRRQFLQSCERANIIASSSNDTVKICYHDAVIDLKAQASNLGDFFETLPIVLSKGGKPLNISFNIKLIMDFLRVVEDDDFYLCFNNEVSPCRFTISSDPNYTYIVMPIRTRDFNG